MGHHPAMELDALRTFAKVAELASFTRAAEQLGLQKGRVSTIVSQLEAQLGTRLLHRTTRTVRLTPDGEQFFERCQTLLADADELQALFQQTPSALRGRLRIDLPIGLARRVVIPRLPEFLAAHPGLEVELSTTDRRVDLVREGMDCKLRVGNPRESGLVARKLGELRQVNCASPAYLQAHGTPRTLADLARHRLVKYATTLGSPPLGWEYMEDGDVRFHDMPGVVTVNSAEAYEAACLAGLGLIQAPVLGMREWIAQGKLVAVMPEFNAPPMPVSLMYAHRRHLPKRVQAFMAWLAEVLGPSLNA
jgi:DNA-binding transcriptional LysR family regulator